MPAVGVPAAPWGTPTVAGSAADPSPQATVAVNVSCVPVVAEVNPGAVNDPRGRASGRFTRLACGSEAVTVGAALVTAAVVVWVAVSPVWSVTVRVTAWVPLSAYTCDPVTVP